MIFMSYDATYSIVIDRPSLDVWEVIRDFNSYPIWVAGVTQSHIEENLCGTAVGSVRNFAIGNGRVRQRLVALSDRETYFEYEGCSPQTIDDGGRDRTMFDYTGSLRLLPVSEGDRCLAAWSSRYECDPEDADFWMGWWADSLPTWLGSLRRHVLRVGGV
jgi:hypothetical protein